jgi:hypothetical protein
MLNLSLLTLISNRPHDTTPPLIGYGSSSRDNEFL